jgi:hypothetical protein
MDPNEVLNPRAVEDDEDDVEGHRLKIRAVEDDEDDVEGHVLQPRNADGDLSGDSLFKR